MKNKIILALDVRNLEQAEEIIERFSEHINIYKVGPFLFYRSGWKIIDRLKKQGKRVFLDLKIHDIPNVVKEGVKIAAEKGIDFFTLHISAGKEALHEAVKEKGGNEASGRNRTYQSLPGGHAGAWLEIRGKRTDTEPHQDCQRSRD